MSMAPAKYLSRMTPDAPASIRAFRQFRDEAERRFSDLPGDLPSELAAQALKRALGNLIRKDYWVEMRNRPDAPSDAAWWRTGPSDDGEVEWRINGGMFDRICRCVRCDFFRQVRDTVPIEDVDVPEPRITEKQKMILRLADESFYELPTVEQGVLWTVPSDQTDYFAQDRFRPDLEFSRWRLAKGDHANGIPRRVPLWAAEESDAPRAPKARKVEVGLLVKIGRKNREQ